MAKAIWTKNKLAELYSTIEEGSLEDVEAYVAIVGKGSLPSREDSATVDGPGREIVRTCCCSGKLHILEYLLDEGLVVDALTLEDLFSPKSGSGTRFIEYGEQDAKRLKALIERILASGARVRVGAWRSDYLLCPFLLFHDDIAFLDVLVKSGLYVATSSWGHQGYDYAFSNGYFDLADFLLEKKVNLDGGIGSGNNLGSNVTISEGWGVDAIDWISRNNLDISYFDREAAADTIVYALKQGFKIKPWDTKGGIWAAVINWDRPDLGDALVAAGYSVQSVERAFCGKAETLDWAKRNGLRIGSISPGCGREVLLKAAELHIPPSEWRERDFHTRIETVVPGCRHIGDSLDYDVIKAFLEAGINDGFDAALALDAGRQDIIDLYEKYGVSTARTALLNGEPYINEYLKGGDELTIPEGILRIGANAFKNSVDIKRLILPESLEVIESHAFMCTVEHVVIPRGVKTVAKDAFDAARKIEFYDTGYLKGSVVPQMASIHARWGRTRIEYVVRSTDTGDVKYKVWAPYADMNSSIVPLYRNAWGASGTFVFANIDQAYPKLKSKGDGYGGINDKLMTAINRLRWPISLDEKTSKKYRSYVSKNVLEAVEILTGEDDADRIATVFECATYNESLVGSAIEIAKNAKAKNIVSFLTNLKNSERATNQPQPKEKPKKLSVPQIVTLVSDALDEGDSSKIAELEPIAAKIPMADCVELLERAAANCDGAAIDRLYDVLAPFEYVSSALNVALFSGNVSAAKALISRGADLDGKLKMIDEKRAPLSKRHTREKRYSHGLIGSRYRAGGVIASNLPEALMKWNGLLESRTKTSEPNCSGQTYKLNANNVSCSKAADALIAVSDEAKFKKSIAIRLLWNFISFDGRKTADACFDAKNARKILEVGILDSADLAKLPWEKAISSALVAYRVDMADALKLVKDFAPTSVFANCWSPRFAKPSSWSGKYDEIDVLLLFVDVLSVENCSNQTDVLKALAATGNLTSLKKLSEKPGWFTKQRIKKLIDIATENNETETVAWLLELLSQETLGPKAKPEIIEPEPADNLAEASSTAACSSSGLFEFDQVEALDVAGKIFVLTGLNAADKKKATEAIKAAGGEVKGSVVLKTDFVVVNEDYDHQSTKYLKAKELNETKGKDIKVISSKRLFELLSV